MHNCAIVNEINFTRAPLIDEQILVLQLSFVHYSTLKSHYQNVPTLVSESLSVAQICQSNKRLFQIENLSFNENTNLKKRKNKI